MIDAKIKEKLSEIGSQVKAVLGDVNASVQINVGRRQPRAVVNVNLTDVTEVKK